jgi:hypothetical protein
MVKGMLLSGFVVVCGCCVLVVVCVGAIKLSMRSSEGGRPTEIANHYDYATSGSICWDENLPRNLPPAPVLTTTDLKG